MDIDRRGFLGRFDDLRGAWYSGMFPGLFFRPPVSRMVYSDVLMTAPTYAIRATPLASAGFAVHLCGVSECASRSFLTRVPKKAHLFYWRKRRISGRRQPCEFPSPDGRNGWNSGSGPPMGRRMISKELQVLVAPLTSKIGSAGCAGEWIGLG